MDEPLAESVATGAVAHTERVLVWFTVLIRAGVLIQMVISLILVRANMNHPLVAGLVLTVVIVQSAVFIRRSLRHSAIDDFTTVMIDICVTMAALVAIVFLLKQSANPNTDDVVYPFAVTTMGPLGLVARRILVVIAVPFAACCVYIVATTAAFRHTTVSQLAANTLGFWTWALVTWFVARAFRTLSRQLDQVRQTAIEQSETLIRERERSKYTQELHAVRMAATVRELEHERRRAATSRDLHDRVLQTLEFLGREGLVGDPRIRDHVAADAVWLRKLVRSELDRSAAGLFTRLEAAVARQTAAGLRVELNAAGLDDTTLPELIQDALVGAVTEALTNVRKHSGTRNAVVRATSDPGGVHVTVLDRGRGFDPIRPADGVGLRVSILERISAIGGHVVITSEPGAGTHIELSVPLGGEPGEQTEPAHAADPDCPANS